MHTPVGDVIVTEQDGAITAVGWGRVKQQDETPLLLQAREQLEEYFAGTRRDFDLPLRPAGSEFQQAVWRVMQAIPCGQTLTYGQVAAEIGGQARAVGGARGANPIPIIIPCHRILAANHMGGYSGRGGVDTKQKLLALEGWRDTRRAPATGDLFAAVR